MTVCILIFANCKPVPSQPISIKESIPEILNFHLSTPQLQFNQIQNFFAKEYHYALKMNVKGIVVISNQGDCMNCNASYSRFVERFINDPNVLFLICTVGNYFDISRFLENETQENVFFDFNNKFAELNLLDRSGFIFISRNKVDQILPIKATTMTVDFEYITNRIGAFGSISY